jgi:hypothetical protein
MFGVISFPQKDTKDILNKDHHMFNAFGNFEHSNTFNLVGLQPVSEVGKSFSVQSNEYYPLWFFAVQAVSSRLDIDKKKMLLGYFSENEFNVQMIFSAFESQVIGVQIQLLLEDEQLTSTLINTMNSIGSGEADGLECPFCKASGWICISENQHMQCPFCVGFMEISKHTELCISKEKINEFVEFLYNCGGFQIEGVLQYFISSCQPFINQNQKEISNVCYKEN